MIPPKFVNISRLPSCFCYNCLDISRLPSFFCYTCQYCDSEVKHDQDYDMYDYLVKNMNSKYACHYCRDSIPEVIELIKKI